MKTNMYKPIQLQNPTTLSVKNSINRSPLWRGFLLILLVLVCLALLPRVQGVSPPPDGGYSNWNTAEGQNALFSLTTGAYNTALGGQALFHNTTGGSNTATGFNALKSNTDGSGNTASGYGALYSNSTGPGNAATGYQALYHNTTGTNTATGYRALFDNTTGTGNSATGFQALLGNTIGTGNVANGSQALQNNGTGNTNTAIGRQALYNTTIGTNNIAVGAYAGINVVGGSSNIDIGNRGGNETNTIRIGVEGQQVKTFIAGVYGANAGTAQSVVVNSAGQLGVATSSKRFKDAIKPMDNASEAILGLEPVTFRYKKELDPDGIPQFGLVAEDVEKVSPDLILRDAEGKVYTVRYEAVNAMLLNEFLKAHRKLEEQEKTIAQLKSTITQQMETVAARLKEHDAEIQRVSSQVELSNPTPQTVATDSR
jgi:hypothetical protein